MKDRVNSKYVTEAGELDPNAFLTNTDLRDRFGYSKQILPGVREGQALSARSIKRTAMANALKFSPTGKEFAVATPEGVVIFARDTTLTFHPAGSVLSPFFSSFLLPPPPLFSIIYACDTSCHS